MFAFVALCSVSGSAGKQEGAKARSISRTHTRLDSVAVSFNGDVSAAAPAVLARKASVAGGWEEQSCNGGPCYGFAGSTSLLSPNGGSIAFDHLDNSSEVRALEFPLNTAPYQLLPKKTTGKFIGWSNKWVQGAVEFLEFSVPGGCSVRLSEGMYMIMKRNDTAQLELVVAKDVAVGFLLPVWSETEEGISWQAIQSKTTKQEDGLYKPLFLGPAAFANHCGLVVLTFSSYGKEDPDDEPSPAELNAVDQAWVTHYDELKVDYPCLFQFDPTYHRMLGVTLLREFLRLHPSNDNGLATRPNDFLARLKTDAEEMVGKQFMEHLTSVCPGLL